jgi:hypothetical protein
MRITKTTESKMGTSTVEVDTEADSKDYRLPTAEEYAIIREALDLPYTVTVVDPATSVGLSPDVIRDMYADVEKREM